MREYFEVRVGGFYVKESINLVREVQSRESNGNVLWRSYEFRDGRPTGDSGQCSPGRIADWADRAATPEEVARMQREAADAGDVAEMKELVELVMAGVSDQRLMAEVRRRGLDRPHAAAPTAEQPSAPAPEGATPPEPRPAKKSPGPRGRRSRPSG